MGVGLGQEPELVRAAVGAITGLGVRTYPCDEGLLRAGDLHAEGEPPSTCPAPLVPTHLGALQGVGEDERASVVEGRIAHRTVVGDERVATGPSPDGVLPAAEGELAMGPALLGAALGVDLVHHDHLFLLADLVYLVVPLVLVILVFLLGKTEY